MDFHSFSCKILITSNVTYITPSGSKVVVEEAIANLLEIALEYDVVCVEGTCSGCCSFATCHVKFKSEWLDKTGPAREVEQDLIDFESDTDESSRLSCQIEKSD